LFRFFRSRFWFDRFGLWFLFFRGLENFLYSFLLKPPRVIRNFSSGEQWITNKSSLWL
jgi:hypothetical protein